MENRNFKTNVTSNYIESYNEFKQNLKLYTYYIIIAIVSLLAMVFLPLVGSTVGLEWNLPNTKVGWIVWIVIRLIVSSLNVLIFHSFVCQGKVNIKQNKNYLEANDLLDKVKADKKRNPVSPTKFNLELYGKKGTTIFLTSGLALVAFSQAIFTYNWQELLTYGFVIVMGLIFGVMTMLKVESYWTTEYLEWAKWVKAKEEVIQNDNNQQ